MKNGKPFDIGGIWESWKDPTSGEWLRTFALMNTDASESTTECRPYTHPLTVSGLSDEPDARDLTRPQPAEPMRMWPISTRVNKPENDEPPILEPIELAALGQNPSPSKLRPNSPPQETERTLRLERRATLW
jgi:putative SOS response-associated peptidase YedK